MLQGFLDAGLVSGIHFLAAMGLAARKMNAEMAVEIIVLDRLGSVGHAVHGSGIDMAVILHQDRAPTPGPASVDAFHDLRVGSGSRLAVRMVDTGPALDVENLARPDVLHLESRVMRNPVRMLKPAQRFRSGAVVASAAAGTSGSSAGFFRILALQLLNGFRAGLAVRRKPVPFLESLDGILCAGAVIPVHIAEVSQVLQLPLNPSYSSSLVPDPAGIPFLAGRRAGGRFRR